MIYNLEIKAYKDLHSLLRLGIIDSSFFYSSNLESTWYALNDCNLKSQHRIFEYMEFVGYIYNIQLFIIFEFFMSFVDLLLPVFDELILASFVYFIILVLHCNLPMHKALYFAKHLAYF